MTFNLNDILDAHYNDVIETFTNSVNNFIDSIKNETIINKIRMCIDKICEEQIKIDFNESFYTFIDKVSKDVNVDTFVFRKAIKSDIQLIFVNGSGNVKKNSVYIDDVLGKFYTYMSNTFFRNYVIIMMNNLYEKNKQSISKY